jgi:hypothetical protein
VNEGFCAEAMKKHSNAGGSDLDVARVAGFLSKRTQAEGIVCGGRREVLILEEESKWRSVDRERTERQ